MVSTLRTKCFFQVGASYQYCPQTMSNLPSLFTSNTQAAMNSESGLMTCLRKAISSAAKTNRGERTHKKRSVVMSRLSIGISAVVEEKIHRRDAEKTRVKREDVNT